MDMSNVFDRAHNKVPLKPSTFSFSYHFHKGVDGDKATTGRNRTRLATTSRQ